MCEDRNLPSVFFVAFCEARGVICFPLNLLLNVGVAWRRLDISLSLAVHARESMRVMNKVTEILRRLSTTRHGFPTSDSPLFLSLQRGAPTSYAMRMVTMCVDAAAAAGVPGAEEVACRGEVRGIGR